MRARSLLLVLPLLVAAGCGGDDGGCGTSADLRADPTYAGQYAASYAPRTGAVGARDFRLSVLSDGRLGGYARDPAAGARFEAEVSGTALNTSNACGTGRTYLQLSYALAGGEPQTLAAHRDVDDDLVGTFPVEGTVDGKTGTIGTLTVERVAVTTE